MVVYCALVLFVLGVIGIMVTSFKFADGCIANCVLCVT